MTSQADITKTLKSHPFQIAMKVVRIPGRTDVDLCTDNATWNREASHWHVMISRDGVGNPSQMNLQYSMGSAHKGEPKLADVMYSLVCDTRDIDGQSFEQWASEFGYDSDSRRAERIYRACVNQRTEMLALFTRAELDQLVELFQDY